jgi:hypothetical protein
MTLLSPPEPTSHGEDNELTHIQPSVEHRMTPLHAAIPLEVITPPLITRNGFSQLNNNTSSTTSAPSGNTATVPSLQHVLLEAPPLDIPDDVHVARTITAIQQHAHETSDTLTQSVRTPRTLLAALARLMDIKDIINASSDMVSTSLAKLQGNIVALANTSQALTTQLGAQAKTSKLLMDRMDKHAFQLANL